MAYPLSADAMKNWIATQLKKNLTLFNHQMTDLIYQYTQGNMLACAQVIDKIALSHPPNSQINIEQVQEQLSNQCEHSPFELIDACLLGQADKSIQILRQAANNKTEPTLILWVLTQEIRIHLQLSYLLLQKIDVKTASNQLKIWPQRINLYQMCIKRFHPKILQQLLHYCQTIDERIKSNFNTQVWNSLENLSLSLCLGQLIGDSCAA